MTSVRVIGCLQEALVGATGCSDRSIARTLNLLELQLTRMVTRSVCPRSFIKGSFFSSLVSTYDCRDQRMQIYGDCAPAESSSERRSRVGGDRGHLGRVTRSSGSCRCALPCRAWCTPMSTRGTMTTARHAPSASSPGPTTEPTSCACVRPQYLRLT